MKMVMNLRILIFNINSKPINMLKRFMQNKFISKIYNNSKYSLLQSNLKLELLLLYTYIIYK